MKNHIFFFQMFWKDGLSKKMTLEYDFSCIIRKDDISFSRKYGLLLTQKERWSFSKKYLEILYFIQMFWKDGLPKKFAPEKDLFCNIWKDCVSFFQKIWYFFFRRKMKEDDLYQKTRGNMIFSVYMRRLYRRDIALLAKKQRCPQKIHLRVTSPASPKKMIFILDSSWFC